MPRAPFYLLGIDPGLSHMGLAVLRVAGASQGFVAVEVCETDKDTRKATRAAGDNTRRARYLANWLDGHMRRWTPLAVCAEELCHVRNASAAGKISLSWGIVVGLCARDSAPIVEVGPKDRIRRTTGLRSATKAQVQEAMEKQHPELAGMWPRGPRGGGELVEHAADAASVVLACLQEDAIRAIFAVRR